MISHYERMNNSFEKIPSVKLPGAKGCLVLYFNNESLVSLSQP